MINPGPSRSARLALYRSMSPKGAELRRAQAPEPGGPPAQAQGSHADGKKRVSVDMMAALTKEHFPTILRALLGDIDGGDPFYDEYFAALIAGNDSAVWVPGLIARRPTYIVIRGEKVEIPNDNKRYLYANVRTREIRTSDAADEVLPEEEMYDLTIPNELHLTGF